MNCQRLVIGRYVALPLFMIVISALFAPGAGAMGFRVQPSKLAFEAPPGRTAVAKIEIRNTKVDEESLMKVTLSNVAQGENGALLFPNTPDETGGKDSQQSCKSWIQIAESQFLLAPGAAKELEVRFVIPANARGDHYAAIMIQSVPKSAPGKVGISIRFAVVAELTVSGRTAAKDIHLINAGLVFMPKTGKDEAHDTGRIGVSNSGEVKVVLDGTLTVFEVVGKKNRRVMSLPVEHVKVLPGSAFDIVLDASRRLPSGKYRVVAQLSADKRRLETLTKDIDYVGDPDIKTLLADAAISIQPTVLDVRGTPLSTRKRIITVKNEAAEALRVTCRVDPVARLKSVSMDGVLGTELGCEKWAAVQPDTFEIKPGRVAQIPVIYHFPEATQLRPTSYANLVFDARYEDGQQAAKATTLVVARNAKVKKPRREIKVMRAGLSSTDSGVYDLSLEYGNVGETDLNLLWTAEIRDAAKSKVFQSPEFLDANGLVLPMETKQAHGILKSSSLGVGEYLLTVEASAGKDKFNWEYKLAISEDKGTKKADLHQTTEAP